VWAGSGEEGEQEAKKVETGPVVRSDPVATPLLLQSSKRYDATARELLESHRGFQMKLIEIEEKKNAEKVRWKERA